MNLFRSILLPALVSILLATIHLLWLGFDRSWVNQEYAIEKVKWREYDKLHNTFSQIPFPKTILTDFTDRFLLHSLGFCILAACIVTLSLLALRRFRYFWWYYLGQVLVLYLFIMCLISLFFPFLIAPLVGELDDI